MRLYFGSAFGSIDNSETSFFEILILSAYSVFQWLVWGALYYSYKVVWAGTRWYLMVHGVMEGISWQWYVLLVYKCHCWMEYISRSRLSICLSFYSFMFQVKLLIWNETRRWPMKYFFLLHHFPPINPLILPGAECILNYYSYSSSITHLRWFWLALDWYYWWMDYSRLNTSLQLIHLICQWRSASSKFCAVFAQRQVWGGAAAIWVHFKNSSKLGTCTCSTR